MKSNGERYLKKRRERERERERERPWKRNRKRVVYYASFLFNACRCHATRLLFQQRGIGREGSGCALTDLCRQGHGC